ncbi:hypothetical protein INQ51_12355 [Maribellus sp. CM-23]|uniref:hypothetical protein n=1 Tax=Maribellus sp. CM-23 TaxID=2781026 RepID=UPI001F2C9646|nr:hypothetical protein [Maribellus sp. CM-23]MCE4565102.1 hypothetical protein [Maribellus sp. CM-23]
MQPDNFLSDNSSIIAFYQLIAAIFLGGSTLIFTKNVIVEKVEELLTRLEIFWVTIDNVPNKYPIVSTRDYLSKRFISFQFKIFKIDFARFFLNICFNRFVKRSFVYRYLNLGLLCLFALLFFYYVFDESNLFLFFNLIVFISIFLITIEFFNSDFRSFLLSPITFSVCILLFIFILMIAEQKDIHFFELNLSVMILHVTFVSFLLIIPTIHFIVLSFIYRIDSGKDDILNRIQRIIDGFDEEFDEMIVV